MRIWTKATGIIEASTTGENPKTAEAVWSVLPIKGNANRWGEEIYFSIPVDLKEEKARAEVEMGSVAYWPPGKALCIFFGATPVSKHGEPRAYSPVNVFAKVVGDPTVFRKVRDKDEVLLERHEG
ncbi:cyclophilin-like fold protein [[Eubacterium] cellulosolvens]